ncbi:hypothetical protein Tco_1576596 [Tanacetum coccineum]
MAKQLEDIYLNFPSKKLRTLSKLGKAGHSQKWHDGSTSRKVSNGSSDGIAAIANILDSLERDMKELKENVHVIQVASKLVEELHLD